MISGPLIINNSSMVSLNVLPHLSSIRPSGDLAEVDGVSYSVVVSGVLTVDESTVVMSFLIS